MSANTLRLTENQLSKVIADSLKNVLNEAVIYTNEYKNIKVEFIERDDILKIADIIWNILTISYENIGGLKTYRNKKNFLSLASFAKIASIGGKIVACAIYRPIEESYKMVAIGSNQETDGKAGVKAIILDDIKKMDFHFWAEVSGPIEHYFKKYNGYPIPNTLASEILGMQRTIKLSTTDKVHYEREISDEWFQKAIYGFKNVDVYNKTIEAVENYSSFMEEVNKLNEVLTNNKLRYNLKQAMYIVDCIIDAYEEGGYRELIPSWEAGLKGAYTTLLSTPQTKVIDHYINYAYFLLQRMTPLKMYPLRLLK